MQMGLGLPDWSKYHIGNSLDKLRHPRSDAYSVELVLLNKQQVSGGGAYPDCYRNIANWANFKRF